MTEYGIAGGIILAQRIAHKVESEGALAPLTAAVGEFSYSCGTQQALAAIDTAVEQHLRIFGDIRRGGKQSGIALHST